MAIAESNRINPVSDLEESIREKSMENIEKKSGLRFRRYYTRRGEDPYSKVEWEIRDAVIIGEDGTAVFEQKNVEVPKSWSQMATNVVVSKYFRGEIGTSQREKSVKQLISRIVDTIVAWGGTAAVFRFSR